MMWPLHVKLSVFSRNFIPANQMKHMTSRICLILLLLACAASAQRPLRPSDVYRLSSVSAPVVSPDGKWIAYTLSSVDSVKDKRTSDIWMTDLAGQTHLQLTFTEDSESLPAFSPDGKLLSFMSARGKLDHAQIWVMDRRGGEARQLTKIAGEISEYVWSPDGKKILLVMRDLERADSMNEKPRDPIVIDRIHFKQDVEGYKLPLHQHLYLFDVATKKLDTLTAGRFDESAPAWSPDGQRIAFVSNRTADPDRNGNTDIWLMDSHAGAPARQLTDWAGSDRQPVWHSSGKRIAYVRSTGTGNFLMYEQSVVCELNPDAVLSHPSSSTAGGPSLVTAKLDRDAREPQWSADGNVLAMLVEDDRRTYISEARGTNSPMPLNPGDYAITALKAHPAGGWVVLMSSPDRPAELHLIENGVFRRLTNHHDEFLNGIVLSVPRGFTSKSKDGTLVSNILYLPPGNPNGKKLPTVFSIHGGPVSQDNFGFDLSRQMLAAQGYAVCAVNYRGSNGRGLAFTKAIWSDWGNKEVQDIFGATDHLVAEGIADPSRLGIGGWSYGGILTNYCIATDPLRFKAATSGAGSSLQLSMFGVDQYITQFENELGYPWKNLDKYLKLSYPFLKADRIRTPTLFLTGEKDFNVPAVGSEQMYQALRVLGVPTQLVVYPGQYHGISTPSYQADRFRRYAGWFKTHLDNPGPVKLNSKP